MSGMTIGPRGIGYRAACRCEDKECRKTISVFPETGIIQFADHDGNIHDFHLGAEEANALAADLEAAAKKLPYVP